MKVSIIKHNPIIHIPQVLYQNGKGMKILFEEFE